MGGGNLTRFPELDFKVLGSPTFAGIIPVALFPGFIVAGQLAVIGGQLKAQRRMAGRQHVVIDVSLLAADMARGAELSANLQTLGVAHSGCEERRAAYVALVVPDQPVLGPAVATLALDPAQGHAVAGFQGNQQLTRLLRGNNPLRVMALGALPIHLRAGGIFLSLTQPVNDRLKLGAHQRLRRPGMGVVSLIEQELMQAGTATSAGNSPRLRAAVATDRVAGLAADEGRIRSFHDGERVTVADAEHAHDPQSSADFADERRFCIKID